MQAELENFDIISLRSYLLQITDLCIPSISLNSEFGANAFAYYFSYSSKASNNFCTSDFEAMPMIYFFPGRGRGRGDTHGPLFYHDILSSKPLGVPLLKCFCRVWRVLSSKRSHRHDGSVCSETFLRPRMSSSGYTFCLFCPRHWASTGDRGIDCRVRWAPLCRGETVLPAGGFARLPNAFLVEKLLKISRAKTGTGKPEAVAHVTKMSRLTTTIGRNNSTSTTCLMAD